MSIINPGLNLGFLPLNPFKSEENCSKELLILSKCILDSSLVLDDTTIRIAVLNTLFWHLLSTCSNTFGSTLKLAFSGSASFFLDLDIHLLPAALHLFSAGEIRICTTAPSS